MTVCDGLLVYAVLLTAALAGYVADRLVNRRAEK